jgi:hypothetical protein
MDRIRDAIKTTDTPSWLDSVPFNFGDKAAGTLKAAEWRVLITVYIPIALIILWGEGSIHDTPATARFARQTLDHTMAFVSAVILIFYRSSSTSRSEAFLRYILEYIRDLTIIHKNVQHRPSGHMSIHLYEFLVSFGPVRSWWTFPFEHLIGRLQQLPHNDHFGVLESTLMRTCLRSSNLKRRLSNSECPEVLRQCKILLDKAFGIRNIDDDDEEEEEGTLPLVTPPPDLLPLIDADKVTLRARLRDKNIIYARSSTHMGNSLIHFYSGGSTSSPAVPGSIKYIFRSRDGPFMFAVHRQLPVSDDAPDPFRHYPHFPAKLYSSALSDHLELVQVDWVLAHFARWQFSESQAVVLSLSKVWKNHACFYPCPDPDVRTNPPTVA